jgi:hypothetical protein
MSRNETVTFDHGLVQLVTVGFVTIERVTTRPGNARVRRGPPRDETVRAQKPR